MNEKLRAHIDRLFADAPQTVRTVELKEEMLQNLIDKYNDLRAEGKTEDAAYNIAVASIGDVRELLGARSALCGDAEDKRRAKSAVFVSLAIALYILSLVPVILISGNAGPALMFVMIALATALLIYNRITGRTYMRRDDTMVEEFKEWKQENKGQRQAVNAMNGLVWLIGLGLYFYISFMTQAWYITWLVFPITGAACSVIRAIFDLVNAGGK